MREHHPVFSRFEPWRGEVPAGFATDMLGTLTRTSYFELQREEPAARYESPPLPAFDEEYFEWIDLLEAAADARERFVLVELGAGWGRWLVAGARAAAHRSLPSLLVGVEAEPQHFAWLEEHFLDNGLDPAEHRLVHAAAAARDGRVAFETGNADRCYGQRVPASLRQRLGWRLRGGRVRRVRAVSLASLLADLPVVDLVDADVQGSEADVFEAAADALRTRVRRVHIGTHGDEQHERIDALFTELGWERRFSFAPARISETPFGRIAFQDGVQSWLNPAL